MDIFLSILAVLFGVLGIIGSFLPILPGPPLAWLGILFMYFTDYSEFSPAFLWITFAIMVVVTVLDYVIPPYFTRLSGGSRYASWGAVIGLVVGLFVPVFPPFSAVIMSFLFSLFFELAFADKAGGEAFRAALGAFFGFILSTGMKFVLCGLYFFYIVREIIG